MAAEYQARYWHKQKNGKIRCDLCPRGCSLNDGQRGFCFIRQRQGNAIVLTSYGRSTGFAIDPIEKKPLNHFYPGSKVLSFGTAGCNLNCKFCQNWNLSRPEKQEEYYCKANPVEIAEIALLESCKTIAFTYNDPVIFMEYALDTAVSCHKLGIKTVAVTAGYINSKPREEFFSQIDAANIDLKSFNPKFYQKYSGGKLEVILETLEYVKKETNTWLEITCLLIPNLNDSDSELNQMTDWIAAKLGKDVPIHFSAFHPDYKMSDLTSTSVETLIKARNIAKSKDLNYVYTGNVLYQEGDATYCPECGTALIEREWFKIKSNKITTGKCPECSYPIPGCFEN